MKYFVMLFISVLATNPSVFAESNDSHPNAVVAQFATAFGYPDANTVEAIKKDLAAEWIGKSSAAVQVWIRHVIQNRGTMGAVQGSDGGYLALSYWSASLNKDTGSLSIRFICDDTGKVTRIESTYKT